MHNFWKDSFLKFEATLVQSKRQARSCLVKYANWVGFADQYCLVAEYQK